MSSNGETTNIPVIDISSGDAAVGKALIQAAEQYGFVFVKNLGNDISTSDIDEAFQLSKAFFASPVEEKARCSITAGNMGWSSMHSETLDPENQKKGDFKEAFNMGEFKSGKAQQPLPPSLKPHEARLARFSDLCHSLCMKILELFAVGLQIQPADGGKTWFSSRHDPSISSSGSIFRILFYPAKVPSSEIDRTVDIRAGAHSDYGSITLLFQLPGQPGLEIQTPSSTWAAVPVQPPGTVNDPSPPILVNIGDLLSYWTNGLLKSTVHRVIFPRGELKDRYSIAYFCHPVNETELVPVPSEIVKKRSASQTNGHHKKTLTAAEHLRSRLAATYGWTDDEGGKEGKIEAMDEHATA